MRSLIGETSLTALATSAAPAESPEAAEPEAAEVFAVSHADGRRWTVVANAFRVGVDLPESCGKRAIASQEWRLRLQ